ncbi:hypothetical protein ACF0H5_001888 [Mactra antiquata]
MSVSDPLIKKLKAFVIALRSKDEVVKDGHNLLQPLCETLEDILLKGLKSSNSWFGSNSCEYWTWISKIPSLSTQLRNKSIYLCPSRDLDTSSNLPIPTLSLLSSVLTKSDRGRGRHFIRTALVKRILVSALKVFKTNQEFTQTYYTEYGSILGNEILIEILSSLLLELQEVTFNLLLKVYKQYELVPSEDLGLDIRTVKGYPLVTQVDPSSVAGEDEKICVGDVLDEMCGECLRGVGKSGVYFIFNQHEGQPIQLCVIKSHNPDGSIYRPIEKLLQMKDLSPTSPEMRSPDTEFEQRPPPESILPEEIEDEIPVHDSEGKAKYSTVYLGNAFLGKDGRVDMIEHGVAEVLKRSDNKQNVMLELGEKDVTITDSKTKNVIFQHLFTEISSCGRRTDALKYFAFIAGDTYCSLSQKFYCHVFEATTEEEAKIILCTMAQGFDRTHLMT